MKKKAILGLFGGVVFALSASIAQATIIKFDYVATGNGGTVTGTFGYNDTVSDTNSDASFGSFPAAGFLTGTVTNGPQNGIFFQNLSVTVGTNDDAGSTPYQDYFGVNFRVTQNYFTFIEFVNFSDTKPVSPLTTDQIASPLLPGTLTNLANWDIGRVVVYANSQELEYTLESVSRVPEPTTLASMTLGLAGIGFARKKKQIKLR